MGGSFIVSVVRESQAAGRRYLLTCAITRYQHCEEWNREELSEDVHRVVQLLCGDFLRAEADMSTSTSSGTAQRR